MKIPIDVCFPWLCEGGSERRRGNLLLTRARRVWPDFVTREEDVAAYMSVTGCEFWEACVAVLGQGDGAAFHVCPRCGHGWPNDSIIPRSSDAVKDIA